MDAAVERTAVRTVRRAEVEPARVLAIPRHVQRVLGELARALVLRRRDGHHRYAERCLERVHVHRAAVLGKLVHHVEGEHHGPIKLHELKREVEVPFDVRGVHDIDDGIRLLFQDELAAYYLLACIGRKRVDARQIGDGGVCVPLDLAVLAVHRHAWEVAHMLVGAGELVEKRRFAAVLVAGEGKAQGRGLGKGRRPLAARARGLLAERRMSRCARLRVLARTVMGVVHVRERDARGVGSAQRELVAAQTNLERIAHRSVLHHGHFGAGGEPHIEDVLPQDGIAGIDRFDDGVLADF